MWSRSLLLLLAATVCGSLAVEKISFLNSYWSKGDSEHITAHFLETLKTKNDLAAVHYAASGLRLLNAAVDDVTAKSACDVAKKADLKDLEQLFHAASIAGDLKSCALASTTGVKETLEAVPKEEAVSTERLFDALTVADRLKIKLTNTAEFDKAISAAIAKDLSPKSLGNALAAASLLDKTLGAKYFDKISSLIEQADEVDGKYLQLDGGLSVTATAVYAIAQLAEQQGKPPAVNKEQLLQVTNYLLSRRQVFAERAAYNVLRAIGVLINNRHFVPVTVTLESAADAAKPLRFHVSNAYGLPINGITVKAEKVTNEKGEVIEKAKALTKAAGDSTGTFFELSISDKATTAGFYTVQLAVESQDRRLVGATGITFKVKQAEEAVVEGLKITVSDKDGSKAAEQSIAQFSKAGKRVEADTTNKLSIAFSVQSKAAGQKLKPHQTFVIFEHVATGQDVIFVADPQTDGSYLIDINIAKHAEDFEGLQGEYRIRITVGDAFIRTPISWIFADAKLAVPAVPAEIVQKSEEITYDAKPTIDHLFREPEKRPPGVVSDAFSILCLAPLVLLFILWLRIGVNISNIPVSLYVLIFHGGLTALFGLYFVFWLRLNMFETLKYLAVVAAITFFAGHRLLRLMVEQRKAKKE